MSPASCSRKPRGGSACSTCPRPRQSPLSDSHRLGHFRPPQRRSGDEHQPDQLVRILLSPVVPDISFSRCFRPRACSNWPVGMTGRTGRRRGGRCSQSATTSPVSSFELARRQAQRDACRSLRLAYRAGKAERAVDWYRDNDGRLPEVRGVHTRKASDTYKDPRRDFTSHLNNWSLCDNAEPARKRATDKARAVCPSHAE
jgi:hypothetical protein